MEIWNTYSKVLFPPNISLELGSLSASCAAAKLLLSLRKAQLLSDLLSFRTWGFANPNETELVDFGLYWKSCGARGITRNV